MHSFFEFYQSWDRVDSAALQAYTLYISLFLRFSNGFFPLIIDV